jgi:hypothetical protein
LFDKFFKVVAAVEHLRWGKLVSPQARPTCASGESKNKMVKRANEKIVPGEF